jgi:hypothetical protein
MDAALDDPVGVRLQVPDLDAAYNLRLRLNQARKLDRDQNKKIHEPDSPMHGRSEYDRLVFRIKAVNGQRFLYVEQTLAIAPKIEPLATVKDKAVPARPVPLTLSVTRDEGGKPQIEFKRRF